ncbi:MAG TPA: 2-phospho-L-lactate transferase [Candidatus Binataceae bacterium]|nr:2-phospho-L-lactate transferase [Candidatus Binataceae bacterium]
MGAAKFLRGLVRIAEPHRITIIVNTGDDEQFYGLHVAPDLDTITYTLAGVVNRKNGWGRAGESFRALGELERFYGPAWFNLGDRDLATHLYRSERLHEGAALSEVTAEIAARFRIKARILPMSNERVHTHVKLKGRPALPFQEYFVRRRARGSVEAIELRGIEQARPAPGVLEALAGADAVIIAPSNPFVSIGPILGVRGVREALRAVRDRVVAISPIVGGRSVKGPADRMLRGMGHEVSARGVANFYRDCAGAFVLDEADRRQLEAVRRLGINAVATDTIMSSPARAAALAAAALAAVGNHA